MIVRNDKAQSVTLRPVVTEDEPFLLRVYASTREEELVGWDERQKEIFVGSQFALQRADYQRKFPDAAHDIILLGEIPIGRMMVDRSRPDEIIVVDIAILSEYRNSGAGTKLIQDLLAEARATRKPIHLHVIRFNRAIRLYERFGFVKIGEIPTHIKMEFRPTY